MSTEKKKTILKYVGIENIKKLTKVELKPDGNSILIKGKNERGKTTLLDCVLQLFSKKPFTDDMVQRGTDKGKMEMVFSHPNGSDYRVTALVVNEKSDIKLEVRPAEGGKPLPSPKAFLSAAAGVYFDIFEMMELEKTAAGQRKNEEMLLKLAHLDIDKIKKFNDDLQKKEDARLIVGRQQKDAQGHVNTIREQIDIEKYTTKIVVADITKKFYDELDKVKRDATKEATEVAETFNDKFDKEDALKLELANLKTKDSERVNVQQALDGLKEKMQASVDRIKELEQLIEEENKKFDDLKSSYKRGESKLQEFNDITAQITDVEKKIADIEKTNEKVTADQKAAVLAKMTEVKNANLIAETSMKEAMDKELLEAEDYNKNVEKVISYKENVEELARHTEEYKAHSEYIEDLRIERRNYIRTGSFPVPGLVYNEEKMRITYKEDTLSEMSMSYGQSMELGMKMSLAYNEGAGLNVICVPNASLLDDEKLNAMDAMVKEHGMIAFYEIVENNPDEDVLHFEIFQDLETLRKEQVEAGFASFRKKAEAHLDDLKNEAPVDEADEVITKSKKSKKGEPKQ